MEATQLEGWNPERGLGLDGVEMAGAAILLSSLCDDPFQVLREAVSLGGDTDTAASIALGLFAARASIASLPEFCIHDLENGPFGRDYILESGQRLAAVCSMPVQICERANYSGQRKVMVVHPLDGVLQPILPPFIRAVMNRLLQGLHPSASDVIVGVDAGGHIPALAASMVSGLPVYMAVKADLETGTTRLSFREEHSAIKDIFVYSLPSTGRAIIVDDEITTGQTVVNLAQQLRRNGWEVLGVVVPIESTTHGARQLLAENGLRLVSHTRHSHRNTG